MSVQKKPVTSGSSFTRIRPFIHLIISALCGAALFTFVELTPKIDENFFFSSDDPQFQSSRKLEEQFQLPPQIIMVAEGDIRSRPYLDRVASLTADLQKLDGVKSVNSLGAGPGSVEGAIKSPLWSRAIIAVDQDKRVRGSNFFVNVEKRDDYGPLVEQINRLKSRYDSEDFRMAITGTPYVVHEIQKQLMEDMRFFTLAAIVAFSLVIAWIYRSAWILLGALVCASTAAFLDFLLLRLVGVDPGPLSANLWSIVFILTLSHVVFISGNWELISRESLPRERVSVDPVKAALTETGTASVWSMITNSLGFLTLLFTAAKPIRQFGLAGMVGSVLALVVTYSTFPAFLRMARSPSSGMGRYSGALRRFLPRRHYRIAAVMMILAGISAFGFRKIDTHPPIYTYFEREGRIREDLIRIDQLGGVSPFLIAVKDHNGKSFRSDEAYIHLWELQLRLESHPQVGEVISLPVLLSEFVVSPLAPFLTWDLIYSILDLSIIGEPGRTFVTADRKTGLYLLRMKETALGTSTREEIVEDLLKTVRSQGFDTVLTGGLFQLTGELSTLVSKSLLQGVFGLAGMLLLIAWVVSRSLPVSLAVVTSLVIVPICVLGAAGFLHIPLEIISTPGINLAMGLGVDEMIHLVHQARKGQGRFDLEEAVYRLWKPISTSTMMLALGFSVFSFSHFPPTQNMGWLVVIGSCVALVVMLLVFPTMAAIFLRLRGNPDKEEGASEDLPRKAA